AGAAGGSSATARCATRGAAQIKRAAASRESQREGAMAAVFPWMGLDVEFVAGTGRSAGGPEGRGLLLDQLDRDAEALDERRRRGVARLVVDRAAEVGDHEVSEPLRLVDPVDEVDRLLRHRQLGGEGEGAFAQPGLERLHLAGIVAGVDLHERGARAQE